MYQTVPSESERAVTNTTLLSHKAYCLDMEYTCRHCQVTGETRQGRGDRGDAQGDLYEKKEQIIFADKK